MLEGTSMLEGSLVLLESPSLLKLKFELLEMANMGDVPGNDSLVLAFSRFFSLTRNFTIVQNNIQPFH